MRRYQDLPAAASIEQAIILAQRLILRDLERGALGIPARSDQGDRDKRIPGPGFECP